MKKFTLLILIVLVAFTGKANAQTDTLVVPPLTDDQPTAINKFIQEDTDAPEGRVYKLQRGAKYIFNQTCEINRSLRITSDPGPEDTPPAMIIASPDPESGELVELWFYLTGNNIELDVSNVMFQGVAPTKEYIGAWLFTMDGDTLDISYDNVIFNGFGGGVSNVPGQKAEHVKIRVTNCIFRNIQFQNHPFMGQSVMDDAKVSQLYVMKNNTFFNCNSYIIFARNPCDSMLIEHNTFFGNSIQPIWNFQAINATIRDNIFYAMFSLGVPKDADDGGWFADTDPAIISLHTLDPGFGIDEKDRKVVITNNAYFMPTAIQEYLQKAIDEGADSICVKMPLWINDDTKAMFDDDSNYPNLVLENNFTDKDPGFREGIVDTIVEQRIDFDNKFSHYSWEMPAERPYHYAPNGDIFNVPWPLPEDLSYSNAELLTASSTGGPLGDPRWYGGSTGVRSIKSQRLDLMQNYPNPFGDYTDITFDVENTGRAVLAIYNLMGQHIKTLVDKEYTPGTYTVRFHANDLPDGIYFYKLRMNGKEGTRKMIIQR
jgi:hypothetical protein